MNIIVLGAHPDDAETGAGGFCIKATQYGHSVTIIHMSSGRKGRKIEGIPESKVRKEEGEKAGKILGVKVEFLNYPMSEIPATPESSRRIMSILKRHHPDIVLTHWPVDSHPDHQVAGILPLRPFIWSQKFCLGFYEVYSGIQTLSFLPNRYIDISNVVEIKRKGILAHKSQNPEAQVLMHEKMSSFRGIEAGCKHAEAFYILGGEMNTPFDTLFKDIRKFQQSGGLDRLNMGLW
ncbi:MAG: PIG-L family deacetylase [Candidatus Ratteibacteria bacterium]|nr:PIG-L family deacetylase [Candidatus Ratteibacteria bacterium]